MTTKGIKRTAFILCVLIMTAIFSLAIWQYYELEEAKSEHTSKKHELANTKDEITQIKDSLKRYAKEKEQFEKYLFNERDIPAFLDSLSESAKELQLNITDMKTKRFKQVKVPEETATGSDIQKKKRRKKKKSKAQERRRILTLAAMPIQMKIEGTYESFAQFFNDLQNYEQLLNISEIKIESSKEYPTLLGDFIIQIYSLKTLEGLKDEL